jgi:hypothetical protein
MIVVLSLGAKEAGRLRHRFSSYRTLKVTITGDKAR